MKNQKEKGQYFTRKTDWFQPQVIKFIKKYMDIEKLKIFDPFAGAGDLLDTINSNLLTIGTSGFDIDNENWNFNDSLKDIPAISNNVLVVSNPPYYGKSSASKNKSKNIQYFKNSTYDDIYLIAIEQILKSSYNSIIIVPETYLRKAFFKNLFAEYLVNITIIEEKMFLDTDCPVCVCCFSKNKPKKNIGKSLMFEKPDMNFQIYKGNNYLFDRNTLKKIIDKYLTRNQNYNVKFNTQDGNLGFRAIDGVNTNERAKFCFPDELNYDRQIKSTSRAITKIKVDFEITTGILEKLNKNLEAYREDTYDVLFAPFKGNNNNGVRRRRVDYDFTRKFIEFVKTKEIKNVKS